jgi:hypothetical protein
MIVYDQRDECLIPQRDRIIFQFQETDLIS